MEKENLLKFIQKYSLGGLIESVVWKAEDKKLSVRFISDDKTLLGQVEFDGYDAQPFNVGIYTTSTLKSLVSVLDESLSIKIENVNDRAVSMKITSEDTSTTYQLADISVISVVPELKKLPDFDVEVEMSSAMIDRFVKSKTAMSDVSTFTMHTDDGDLKMTIGYSNASSNRITLLCQKKYPKQVKPISFSATYLKEIFVANKGATSAKLFVSTDGLAFVEFDIDNFKSRYYLVEISN